MALKNFLKKEDSKKKTPVVKKVKRSEAFKILKEPHISEKSTEQASENKYIFKVFPKANKKQIKKAVEDIYNVNVLKVRVINVPSKKRRLGMVEGEKKGYKKAVVKIKKGQTIELL